MLRLILFVLFAANAASAYAMTLAYNYEPINRSEFVSGLLAVGLRHVSATELETPEGYRLNLRSASQFQVLKAWLNHKAFNGTFCLDEQLYQIVTFDDPSERNMADREARILEDKFRATVAFERIGDLGLWVYRDLPVPPELAFGRPPCSP